MARGAGRFTRPDNISRPLFKFCVVGRPVSAQAQNRLLLGQWKAVVADAARIAWAGRGSPIEADVELRVTHYAERRIADRDNLLKPIQDALQGIAFGNDRQVRDATSNWRNIDGRFTIRNVALPLAVAFSEGREFLHVRLWLSPTIEDLG